MQTSSLSGSGGSGQRSGGGGPDLARVRQVTTYYAALQGLGHAPPALCTLGACALALRLPWPPPLWYWAFVFVGLPLSLVVGYRLVPRLYRAAYGAIEPTPEAKQQERAATWVTWVWCGGALLADVWLEPPVSLFGLSVAVLLPAYWRWTGRFRTHYLLLGPLMAGLVLLPLTGVGGGRWDFALLLGVSAGALVIGVGGLLDHHLLVRTFGPVADSEADEAVLEDDHVRAV